MLVITHLVQGIDYVPQLNSTSTHQAVYCLQVKTYLKNTSSYILDSPSYKDEILLKHQILLYVSECSVKLSSNHIPVVKC